MYIFTNVTYATVYKAGITHFELAPSCHHQVHVETMHIYETIEGNGLKLNFMMTTVVAMVVVGAISMVMLAAVVKVVKEKQKHVDSKRFEWA